MASSDLTVTATDTIGTTGAPTWNATDFGTFALNLLSGVPAGAYSNAAPDSTVLLTQNGGDTTAPSATDVPLDENGEPLDTERTLPSGAILTIDRRRLDNGSISANSRLTLDFEPPSDITVQLPLEVGPGQRYNYRPVETAQFRAYTYVSGSEQAILAQVALRLAPGKFAVVGSDDIEGVTEDGAIAVKRLIEREGGIDAFLARIESAAAEAAGEFAVPPEQIASLAANLRTVYEWGVRADEFAMRGPTPGIAGEEIVAQTQRFESDPAAVNALLDRLGERYGLPGGARPWTEWLNDSNEIPFAQLLSDTAARFPDVTEADLATVIFGEGAGFFDIKYLGADFEEFASRERSGFTYWGLDTFADMAPELKAKGYLPADFTFEVEQEVNELGQTVNSANFANLQDTMLAAGAVWQHHVDMANSMMMREFGRLPESPETRFFYTYAMFNAGPSVAQQMMQARGVDYVPRWDNSLREGNDQSNAIYNSTVRVMQRAFFNESGVFE